MIPRRILLAIALVAGALSGGIYYFSAERVAVVVAAKDLTTIRALSADDLEVRRYPLDAVPAGAFSDPAQLVGRVPRAPLWRGQLLLADSVGDGPTPFHSGLELPPGTRAIALPVAAGQAVGGAITPGARIDVIAVPVAGRAPDDRGTEVIGRRILVVDVRGENGGAYGDLSASGRAGLAPPERLGSVVVAIPPEDAVVYAERILASTFMLVLLPVR